MNVLHVHTLIEIKGGAEVYISQLNDLLPAYDVNSYWIAISSEKSIFTISTAGKNVTFSGEGIIAVEAFLNEFINSNNISLINIHNLFEKKLVELCLKLLPVVKSVHSPVMVCPGRDKFWRHSGQPCTIKYGLHCFYHIYSEGCANRYPPRIFDAWNYVQYEIEDASNKYRKIIVMSDFMKAGLLECNVPESRITVNPYFTPVVEPTQPENNHVKRLVFIGRLVHSKGPHIMINALADFLKSNESIYLDIVGDGLLRGELVDLVKRKGLESKIIFYGWLNQAGIDVKIRNSYLVIFPSIYPEAFGIVGIEAMMRAKPVVAFDVGGVSTWLKDGETGFLIQNKNKDDLLNRIELLLNQPDLYKEMTQKARKNVLRSFIPDVHIKKLIDIYKSAVN